MKFSHKTAGIIASAAVFFMIDRVLKRLFSGLWHQADFSLIGDWFGLKFAVNPGIAFSLPLDYWLVMAFTVISLVFLVWLASTSWRQRDGIALASFAFIIAGSFSNFFDRFIAGGVIDYVRVAEISVFNLADAMIAIGSIVAIFQTIIRPALRAKKTVEPTSRSVL